MLTPLEFQNNIIFLYFFLFLYMNGFSSLVVISLLSVPVDVALLLESLSNSFPTDTDINPGTLHNMKKKCN